MTDFILEDVISTDFILNDIGEGRKLLCGSEEIWFKVHNYRWNLLSSAILWFILKSHILLASISEKYLET